MNLMKSFNFKYMKEVFRESKRLIVFSMLVVPVLTILLLYALSSSVNAISLTELSVINMLLMYVIPFVFSNMFFGFMYKRNSTDFRMSMPLNRKTIFITSIIGGIILIFGLQIVFSISIMICKLLFVKLVIPWKIIWDCFVMCLISYIFVFLVASLASTISGNLRGQVVVTILMLFLVPVVINNFEIMARIDNMDTDSYFYSSNYLILTDGENKVEVYAAKNAKNYTMPYRFITSFFDEAEYYSSQSLIKMIVLGIIYFVIGLKLFEIRKMENNDGSYSSMFLHILIKTLTLVPILMYIVRIATYVESTLFYITVLIMLAIYYFIYDYIVGMKVPISHSVVAFFSSVFILVILICSIRTINSGMVYTTEIDISDIKGISLSANDSTIYAASDYCLSNYLTTNDFIYDEQLINLIFESAINYAEDKEDEYAMITFQLKLGFNKKYTLEVNMSNEDCERIQNYLVSNSNYAKKLENTITSNGTIIYNKKIVKSKYADKINDELENCIDQLIEIDIKNTFNGTRMFYSYIYWDDSDYYDGEYFYKYIYINHELKQLRIPVEISDNMEEIFENIY